MDILHDLTIKQQSVPRLHTYITTYLSTYICIYIFGSTSTSTQVHTSAKGKTKEVHLDSPACLSVCPPAHLRPLLHHQPASQPVSQPVSAARLLFSLEEKKNSKKKGTPSGQHFVTIHNSIRTPAPAAGILFFFFSLSYTHIHIHIYNTQLHTTDDA